MIQNSLGLAFWREPETALVEIHGPEALSYLQSQVTQDLLSQEDTEGLPCALLDRLGKIRVLFDLYRMKDKAWLLCHNNTSDQVIQECDKYHINEDFEIQNHRGVFGFIGITGVYLQGWLASVLPFDRRKCPGRVLQVKCLGHDVALFGGDLEKHHLLWIAIAQPEIDVFIDKLTEQAKSFEIVEVSSDQGRNVRLDQGALRCPTEIPYETPLSGTGLEDRVVAQDKGCYVGQEVVARIQTYGQAPKSLCAFLVKESIDNTNDANVQYKGKKCGRIYSQYHSNIISSRVLLCFLDRNVAAQYGEIELELGGRKINGILSPFPLRIKEEQALKAREHLEVALEYFAASPLESKEHQEHDDQAIQWLKKSIEADPSFPDAYEVIGVIYGRHGQYQEAIDAMLELSRLDPDRVMAFTNLSVFHMKLGHIEEAEKYRDQATALGFQVAAQKAQQKQNSQTVEKERLQEERRKVQVFTEVLELDSEDTPALFGRGMSLYECGDYQKAQLDFEKAISLQEFYSAAYLGLAKTLEQIDVEESRRVYVKGIEVAREQGDLKPLQEMEQRLRRIKSKGAKSS